MARATAPARSATTTGLSAGLATVSISAAVSPKLLLNWIGPAPWGRDRFRSFSLMAMSLNSLRVSAPASSSWTWTKETPGSDMDLMPKFPASGGCTRVFCAIRSSTGRVTSCSTFSALTPGHWVTATATRTGMSGSFRLGMLTYP